jgi:hypothetical protein
VGRLGDPRVAVFLAVQRLGVGLGQPRWLLTLLNIVSILFPIDTIAPMQAMEINDAMSAYSIAVAARLHRINLVN